MSNNFFLFQLFFKFWFEIFFLFFILKMLRYIFYFICNLYFRFFLFFLIEFVPFCCICVHERTLNDSLWMCSNCKPLGCVKLSDLTFEFQFLGWCCSTPHTVLVYSANNVSVTRTYEKKINKMIIIFFVFLGFSLFFENFQKKKILFWFQFFLKVLLLCFFLCILRTKLNLYL